MTVRRKATEQKPVETFLPLTPAVFHILITLADGEAHGYAIMQEVAHRSGGSVRLGPGTLYGAISRLLEDGLLEESEDRANLPAWMTPGAVITDESGRPRARGRDGAAGKKVRASVRQS